MFALIVENCCSRLSPRAVPRFYMCPNHGTNDDDKNKWRPDPNDPVVLRNENKTQNAEKALHDAG